MTRRRAVVAVCGVAVLTLAACAGHGTASTSTTRVPAPTAPPTRPAPVTSTTTPPALVVTMSPSPPVVAVGTTVTFTVTTRAAGVLSVEDIHFGDGGGSGANAGMITCGQSARADNVSTYTHAYDAPGTYTATAHVTVLRPPPTCRDLDAVGSTTVTVAAPAEQATTGGAFVSPTGNLACQFHSPGEDQIRCASFSPPSLVTMGPDGTYTVCTGDQCPLGNPAMNTRALPYGSAVADGPYVCLSSTAGFTCTVPSGRGFTLSRAGVRATPTS